MDRFATLLELSLIHIYKTNTDKTVTLTPEFHNAASLTVDEATGDEQPRAATVNGAELKMAPFAVTILSAQ